MISNKAYKLMKEYQDEIGVTFPFELEQIENWKGLQVFRYVCVPHSHSKEAPTVGYPPYVLFDGTNYRLSTLQELHAIRKRENTKELDRMKQEHPDWDWD